MQEKHQTHPNGQTVYKISDQYSSMCQSLVKQGKTKKFSSTNGISIDGMTEPKGGILNGILEQEESLEVKSKIWNQDLKFS